jgi:hypothetical protein
MSMSVLPYHPSLVERVALHYDLAGKVTRITQRTPLATHLQQLDGYTPSGTYTETTYQGYPLVSYDRQGRLTAR